MVDQTVQEGNVLYDAQDLVVIRPSGKEGYVYAVKPSLAFQRTTYQESISDPNDSNVPAFNGHWQFDDQAGIKGSSTFLVLRYDKRALRPRGLWIPGLLEAKALESAGKLENGVYRDYDTTVYSDGNPNREIANALSMQAEQLGLKCPLINPFKALDYDVNQKSSHGIDVRFVPSPRGIISGDEAENTLNSLNRRGNSGAQWLLRSGGGDWDAGWDDLGYSSGYGRVDWVCGEATRADLEKAHELFMGREYSERIRLLEDEKKKRQSEFVNSLEQ